MSRNTRATVHQAQAKRKNSAFLLMISLNSPSWTSTGMQSCIQGSFIQVQSFPFLPTFQSSIAYVIFHESCSIYQGRWHIEEADECLTPLGLYNERWESETHSEVVSACTKEADKEKALGTFNLGHRQWSQAITPLPWRTRLLVRQILINAWISHTRSFKLDLSDKL